MAVMRGRPRSPEIDQAIREAALALLVEAGYGGMSMEGIAARACVGKAAIYRRWPNKAAVIVDALRGHEAMRVPLPDSGDVRADIENMLIAMQRSLAGEDGPIIAAFAAEKYRHPELREEFDRVFVQNRRKHLQRLVRDAVERGDLPADTDVELFAETGPAILATRLLMHDQPPDPKLPRRIVEQLFGARRPVAR
jgi:AcrR family transcriptional regulator